MKKVLFPLMVLVMVLGLALIPASTVGSAPADDELEVVLSDTGPGRLIYISGYGRPWAGLFHLSVDTEDCKGGEIYYGWCIDLVLPIREGQCFDANLVNAPRQTPWCEIAYIMTHFSPTSSDEAGAIQLAIWKYMGGGQDSVVATRPQSVEDRADYIYEAAENRSVNLFGPGLGLMPIVDGDGGSGYQVFTTTITGSGCLEGIAVEFSTINGSFSSTDPTVKLKTVPTNAGGEASVTLYWDTLLPPTTTITACTEGEWPVIIEPVHPRIQRTVILKPFGLSVERQWQYQPELGSIGDYVWYDENRDTIQDPAEYGIDDITVALYSKASAITLIATTETNATGYYLFPDLEAGNYYVDVDEIDVDMPPGYFSTTYNDPMLVPLAASEDFLDADFGFGPNTPELGIIGDYVWDDANWDGEQDPGEIGIPFVTVILNDENWNYLRETETDFFGNYFFYDNPAGDYYVELDVTDPDLAGYTPSTSTWVKAVIASNFLDADFGLASTLVDARISISPLTDTNKVGEDHDLIALVEVNDGAGWDPAPGFEVTFTKTAGVGSVAPTTDTTDSNGEAQTVLTTTVVGSSTVQASATVTVGGQTFNLVTDGTVGNSGPAEKDWVLVDARISISPLTDTNKVGEDHDLIALVEVNDGAGWDPAPGFEVTFTKTAGVGSVAPTTDTTDSNGEAQTVLTTTVVGSSTVQASATVTVGGQTFNLVTDGTVGNSGPAEKDWVDARISISPLTDTNKVGEDHNLIALVEVNDGAGWDPAPGFEVTFTKTAGVGSVAPTTDTTDSNGEAQTVLTTTVVGSSTVQASATVTVGGQTFNLVTDGTVGNSGPAEKDWVLVDARISISPLTDTNKVGEDHDLTALVEVNDGAGWDPAPGFEVTFTKTAGVGSVAPTTDTTDSNGEAQTVLTTAVAGSSTVQASATVTVGGQTFNLVTDGTVGNSGPAEKDWVDARISISPLTDTNKVGEDHDLIALVEVNDGAGWDPAPGFEVTFTKTAGVGSVAPTTDTTDSNGEAQTVLTTAVAGSSTVQASATVTVGGQTFNLVTDGTVGNSGPAEKDWVDARISISPLTDTNEVGENHNLTALVEVNDGAGWDPAPGFEVTFTKTAGVGSVAPTTDTTDSNGEAQTVLTTTVVGSSTVQASATVTVGGQTFNLVTNGTVGNSGPAEKDWVLVDARISISPLTDTNKVGEDHDLIALVEVNDGAGWDPAPGFEVTFTKTAGVGSVAPTTDTTDSNGEAQTVLTTAVAGSSTVQASATVTVGGQTFNLVTDGTVGNSGPAEKDWVDARISISPLTDTNKVGEDHDLIALVEVNDGAGWDPAPGFEVTFTKTAGVGSVAPTTDTTDSNGEAQTVLTTTVVGSSTVQASATVTVGGQTFNLVTDGTVGNSGPAEKDWVDARISISPLTDTNKVGENHDLIALVEVNDGAGWDPAPGFEVTFTKTAGVGSVAPTTDTTDSNGEAQTVLTTTVVGSSTVQASATVTVGGQTFNLVTDGTVGNSGPAEKDWVDARISISPLTDTNEVGENHNLTALVEVNDGAGWDPAPGFEVTFTKTAGVGSVAPTTDTTDSNGEAQTVLTTTVVGSSTVQASATVTVGGQTFNLVTDGTVGNSGPAEKDWTELHSLQIEKRDKDSGDIIDLPGVTFEITPNPYSWPDDPFTVVDNDVNDADPANGIILLEDILPYNIHPCYKITETVAPPGYLLDSTPQYACVGSVVTVTFYNTRESDCHGLTPGYWKNWRNHYTAARFKSLLVGTIALTIEDADHIFARYRAKRGYELTILRAHLLATQLTLNLGSLSEGCQVEWDGDTWTVGAVVSMALDILANPGDYTREQILKIKDILDKINNMGGD